MAKDSFGYAVANFILILVLLILGLVLEQFLTNLFS